MQAHTRLVVLGVANGWVAEDGSSADDFTHREKGQTVDTVDSSLGDGSLVSLHATQLLEELLLLVGALQHIEPRLVGLLELRLRWWSQTFRLVNGLGNLTSNLSPVDGAVGELCRFGNGRVDETGGLVDDGRHG